MQRTRVLFLLPDLAAGGAQGMVISLLARLPRKEFEPHLALGRSEGPFLDRLPRDVPLHVLGATRAREMPRPLRALAAELRPKTIFSTLYHTNLMLLLQRRRLPPDTRLVVREAIMPASQLPRRRFPRLFRFLLRRLYRRADALISQCDAMADELHREFGVPREVMTTIYNPVDVEACRARAAEGANPFAARGLGPHVVSVGRLVEQKGFDRLVDALPALIADFPGAHVWILGTDGGQLEPLRAQADAAGVGERLHLVGFDPNPLRYLRYADLFVQTSRYEGLPNALLEALAVDCPVIALPEPGGTREILTHAGRAGRAVERLDWSRAWFRGGSEEPPPDLERFRPDRALEAYAAILAPARASSAR